LGCNKTLEASMQADRERLKELKAATARLENEAEQYRTAAESALAQLDWCVDYFNRSRQIRIAKSLRANCGQIRRRYL
jgi:predicted nuclease with TOPRIM domain